MQEAQVQSLGQEDPLEKEMATHSSILAWEIPWTEEPGGLRSWGRKELDMLEHARRIDRACYGNFCYSHEEELKRIKDTPYRSKNLIILISIAS